MQDSETFPDYAEGLNPSKRRRSCQLTSRMAGERLIHRSEKKRIASHEESLYSEKFLNASVLMIQLRTKIPTLARAGWLAGRKTGGRQNPKWDWPSLGRTKKATSTLSAEGNARRESVRGRPAKRSRCRRTERGRGKRLLCKF